MEYRIYLDLTGDGDLAKALRERVESPELGGKTAVFHQGVVYNVSPEGVSVKLESYATEIPVAYKGMVKRVVLKSHLPRLESAPAGPYRRGKTTAVVDVFNVGDDPIARYVIIVEGVELGRVNRLHDDIRTGKADKAHRAAWGTTPASI